MPGQRIGGIIQVQANGRIYKAKGAFTYNIGSNKRETVSGSDTVHGYKETPQPASIEGEFTDSPSLRLADLTTMKDATVTINLANGKTFALYEGYYTGDGNVNTDEGNIGVRFEGPRGKETTA